MAEIPDFNSLKPKSFFGARHVQAIMLFFAMLLAFAMRVNMSVAIVAMTSPSADSDIPAFAWSGKIQSVILSSFFWGYVILQIPGGELAGRFGGKILIQICMLVNSITTLLIPLIAKYGWQYVVAARVVQGLFQGFVFPSCHTLIGKWVPLHEKGRISTLIYAGAQLGTALELMVAGLLGATSIGWPLIFYSLGVLSFLWTIVYSFVGANSPEESKIISEEEKLYIQTSLGHVGGAKKYVTPWSAILTSLPFWALVVAHCGQNWGYWTLLTEMPTYMSKVLNVDIKANGVMSAIPYLGQYALSFPFGVISDMAVTRQWVSITAARKISNSIAQWGPAIALIGLSYSPAGSVMVAVLLLTLTVSLNAGNFTGYLVVHIDMAPNFAGSLMGVTNSIANVISIIAPLAVGFILEDETNQTEWRTVFFLSAGIYFVCNLFFVIFGSSKLQPYNEPKEQKPTIEKIEGSLKHLEGGSSHKF